MVTEERDIEELIEKKARELANKVEEYKRVDKDTPHGIYVYDPEKDVWRLLRREGEAFNPGELGDGAYVLYFDNTRCPACRKYDLHWYPFIETTGRGLKGYYFVIVLCEWFARNCKSPAAAATFKKFNVHASPTTILAYVKNGKKVYEEKYEGYLTLEELLKVVPGFTERGEMAARGEKVEPPLKKGGGEDELIKLLLKLLKGG